MRAQFLNEAALVQAVDLQNMVNRWLADANALRKVESSNRQSRQHCKILRARLRELLRRAMLEVRQ
jgi:uncharacterized iron-regulated protein